jgi:hypothetical protein
MENVEDWLVVAIENHTGVVITGRLSGAKRQRNQNFEITKGKIATLRNDMHPLLAGIISMNWLWNEVLIVLGSWPNWQGN